MKRHWVIGSACSLFIGAGMLASGAAFAQTPITSVTQSLASNSQGASAVTGSLQNLTGSASLASNTQNGSRGLKQPGEETGHPLADSLRQGSQTLAESVRDGGGGLASGIHTEGGNVLSNSEQDTVDTLRVGLDESGGSALSALLYKPGDQIIRKGIKQGGFAMGHAVRTGSDKTASAIDKGGNSLADSTSGVGSGSAGLNSLLAGD